MKILVVCMLHTYGDPKREYSFEYFNFYQVLQAMGHEVELFDYMAEIKALGKEGMNKKLLSRVREWQPTVAVFSLYTDQFEPETVNALRAHTKTFCFFHDDTWRVDYSRYWARHFDYFSTPDLRGEEKYREIGLPNAIYFPFGCNEQISRKLDVPKKYDVSFVGGWHPYREWLINRIRKAGANVEVVGYRWPKGEVDQEGMVKLFNESRINLNLSNSASWDVRYLVSSPWAIVNRLRSKKNIEQMKARIFEVNGCGAFQLSYFVEGLAHCYDIDREIGVYADADDLIDKVKFYLAHESLRESMATAAYNRTLQDHTFVKRFQMVFERMGLLNG
ncbi:MAG: glycosyltransferase [Candidatus Paracaedibacteraceae bacterium]|nr:glycosyltransferase [Candidatus Paracaedibacteraceae bacterium]